MRHWEQSGTGWGGVGGKQVCSEPLTHQPTGICEEQEQGRNARGRPSNKSSTCKSKLASIFLIFMVIVRTKGDLTLRNN